MRNREKHMPNLQYQYLHEKKRQIYNIKICVRKTKTPNLQHQNLRAKKKPPNLQHQNLREKKNAKFTT